MVDEPRSCVRLHDWSEISRQANRSDLPGAVEGPKRRRRPADMHQATDSDKSLGSLSRRVPTAVVFCVAAVRRFGLRTGDGRASAAAPARCKSRISSPRLVLRSWAGSVGVGRRPRTTGRVFAATPRSRYVRAWPSGRDGRASAAIGRSGNVNSTSTNMTEGPAGQKQQRHNGATGEIERLDRTGYRGSRSGGDRFNNRPRQGYIGHRIIIGAIYRHSYCLILKPPPRFGSQAGILGAYVGQLRQVGPARRKICGIRRGIWRSVLFLARREFGERHRCCRDEFRRRHGCCLPLRRRHRLDLRRVSAAETGTAGATADTSDAFAFVCRADALAEPKYQQCRLVTWSRRKYQCVPRAATSPAWSCMLQPRARSWRHRPSWQERQARRQEWPARSSEQTSVPLSLSMIAPVDFFIGSEGSKWNWAAMGFHCDDLLEQLRQRPGAQKPTSKQVFAVRDCAGVSGAKLNAGGEPRRDACGGA